MVYHTSDGWVSRLRQAYTILKDHDILRQSVTSVHALRIKFCQWELMRKLQYKLSKYRWRSKTSVLVLGSHGYFHRFYINIFYCFPFTTCLYVHEYVDVVILPQAALRLLLTISNGLKWVGAYHPFHLSMKINHVSETLCPWRIIDHGQIQKLSIPKVISNFLTKQLYRVAQRNGALLHSFLWLD
jgi:hypothetical protein